MSKAHGQLIKDGLSCFAHHGFNILDPGKVSPRHIQKIGAGIVWKANTGAAEIGHRLIRFGIAGQADIIGFTNRAHFIGAEAKVGKDTLNEDQKSFHHWLTAAHGISIVFRSYDDLDVSLKHWELTQGDNE